MLRFFSRMRAEAINKFQLPLVSGPGPPLSAEGPSCRVSNLVHPRCQSPLSTIAFTRYPCFRSRPHHAVHVEDRARLPRGTRPCSPSDVGAALRLEHELDTCRSRRSSRRTSSPPNAATSRLSRCARSTSGFLNCKPSSSPGTAVTALMSDPSSSGFHRLKRESLMRGNPPAAP